jgi:hypothetical protein
MRRLDSRSGPHYNHFMTILKFPEEKQDNSELINSVTLLVEDWTLDGIILALFSVAQEKGLDTSKLEPSVQKILVDHQE